jgi:hypothetical protein
LFFISLSYNNEEFKEKFKNDQFKILVNPTDEEHAALIIVDKGALKVEKVLNKPKENISKDVLGWDGSISTTRQLFNDMASGKAKPAKLLLKRKLKVHNTKILLKFATIQSLTKEE